jgi:PPOX class probable F420-dependent enzyme
MSVWDRLRHPRATSVAEAQPLTGGFEALDGRKYALLVSYRRSGQAIATPIWFGLGDDTLYVRTEADSFKVKRIRRNPDVLVAACTWRGKPLSPAIAGTARVVEPAEEDRAERALEANYGLDRKLYKRFIAPREPEMVYVAIEPR